jgi:hypothetical protein
MDRDNIKRKNSMKWDKMRSGGHTTRKPIVRLTYKRQRRSDTSHITTLRQRCASRRTTQDQEKKRRAARFEKGKQIKKDESNSTRDTNP